MWAKQTIQQCCHWQKLILGSSEGFFNSLKCQVFSVACHWLLMVVPQMCLTQLEPEAEELISSVQNHASCALQTQDGKSLKPSSWSWAPSPGIGGRDVGWWLTDTTWDVGCGQHGQLTHLSETRAAGWVSCRGMAWVLLGLSCAKQTRLTILCACWGWASEAALLCCAVLSCATPAVLAVLSCPVPRCASTPVLCRARETARTCCRDLGLTSGCCPNPCLVGRQIVLI